MLGPFHGRFSGSRANLPRWRPISWMVRYKTTEPSMLKVDIMEGSAAKGEPSTLEANIVDGSI